MTRNGFVRGLGAMVATGVLPSSVWGASAGRTWWKGDPHLHTLLSDGEGFPQETAILYGRLGYHFVCLADHNRTHARGDILVNEKNRKRFKLANAERFAKAHPELLAKPVTDADGVTSYRLPTYKEMLKALHRPGKFTLVHACEWNNNADEELHCNVTGLTAEHTPQNQANATTSLTNMLAEYGKTFGHGNPDSFFTVNHPDYWYYDLRPQMLIDRPEVRFFEIGNSGGLPVRVDPPPELWTLDRFWDIVLAHRVERQQPLLYGIASDDEHWVSPIYRQLETGRFSRRGYVRVLSDRLTPKALVAAFQRGDFHASTGIDLQEVRFDAKRRVFSVKVDAKPGEEYVIRFIGTKKGFDHTTRKVSFSVSELAERQGKKVGTGLYERMKRTFPAYSPEIGRTLKEVEGSAAEYRLAPDDLYVRARVVLKGAPDAERWIDRAPAAWTQPILPTGPSKILKGTVA